MSSLITSVTVSKTEALIGESIRVDVQTADPAAQVSVNGVTGGGTHYLQFEAAGRWTIVVAACLGKQTAHRAVVLNVSSTPTDAPALPVIGSAIDRYQPRTVTFRIMNSTGAVSYAWDFGDGTQQTSDTGSISHDYSESLGPDKLVVPFHVRVTAQYPNGTQAEVTRTIAVFCVYAHNKTRQGVLCPRVTVFEPFTLQRLGIVLCTFLVQNLEDEELSLTDEQHEWLSTEQEVAASHTGIIPGQMAREVAQTLASVKSEIPAHHPASIVAQSILTKLPSRPSMDVRVPARSTVSILRIFGTQSFRKPIFGVAVHLRGTGTCSKRAALASAYIETRLPLEWGVPVRNPNIWKTLATFQRSNVTHEVLQDFAHEKPPRPSGNPVAAPVTQEISTKPRHAPGEPTLAKLKTSVLTTNLSDSIRDLFTPPMLPFDDEPGVSVGNECDPDNVPDNLPEGMVCQMTGETAWRFVPGRVLNAKKGDVILSPGDQQLIGQLLRQVTPPQYYSHSGIMTLNHVQVRHSTASPEWLLQHPKGGGKPTDGFEPTALKYLWPGTITQSIDQAFYTQWLTSPDKGPFLLHSFSFDPNTGNPAAIVYPLVVKPSPFEETTQVRASLHAIANAALQIMGHYSFYCYSNPAIALDPASVAGAETGWAQGTVPTVCSSFIWLSAQQAGIRLEGSSAMATPAELEVGDVASGAEVDASTPDGLYRYTAEERQAAGRWLYQNLYDQAYNSAGWLGTLLTDAPDDIANQVCNTFASGWADGDSKDSDAWKHTGPANAVSPDNILWWDSPGAGNQQAFRSVYGYAEELFYRPGTYAQVPIYRWRHVETRGTLTGHVVAQNADVSGATVTLLGPGLDATVGQDGAFRFDNVPSGSYEVTAGLNINGYWNSSKVSVVINAGQTTDVTVMLEPPPATDRLVTISVAMTTDWKSIWAHSPYPYFDTRSVRVQPFHSHEHVEMEGSNSPHGKIIFDIDLNADLSITVSWTAQEIDDEVEGEVKGGYTIGQDGVLNWNGLRVVNDDPIDADWSDINFTVTNGQANA